MVKRFYNQVSAAQYCDANKIPYRYLKGNTVTIPNIGGVVVAASSRACKGGHMRSCAS